jgi:hypothetical protein
MIITLAPKEVREACIAYAKNKLLTAALNGKVVDVTGNVSSIQVDISDAPNASKGQAK